jgi:hypothetical protein
LEPRLERQRERTLAFRADYRRTEAPARYSGWLHFWLASGASIAVVAICLAMVRDVTWLQLATVPVTLVYANLAEYLGHRGPMHRRWALLGPIYLHTTVHHRFFTHDVFGYDEPRDFHALLLPPVFLLFFFGFFAVPAGLVLYFLVSPNVAFLGVATAVAYFLCYEWLHFAYHAPESSPIYRLAFMRRLRMHHLLHHDPALMNRYNFNITWPLFDWVFRTTYRGPTA